MEVVQSHMNWGPSNTFDNTTTLSVEDFNIADSGYYQQLMLNEHMVPSHSPGAQADHDDVLQNLDDLEQLHWEPAEELQWLQTMQTMPEFPNDDQSGEIKESGIEDGQDDQSVKEDQADHGNVLHNLDDLEQLHRAAEELQWLPTMQTMPEFPTDDQSGEIKESEVEDGEDDQSVEEEWDEEFSNDHVDGVTAGLTPRPVLPPGKNIGITYHKKNKQWEAHLWIKGQQLRGRRKKGVQIFLGNFDTAEEAKQAHDRAAIKLEVRTTARGKPYPLNFPEAAHAGYIAEHANWTPRDFLWKIRRFSRKFSKGKSSLKGVSVRKRSVKRGQQAVVCYEAKLSQTAKESGDDMKRTFMLGNFASEEEAGKAYDRALLFLHQHLPEVEQLRCITNFRPSSYSAADIEAIGSKLVQ